MCNVLNDSKCNESCIESHIQHSQCITWSNVWFKMHWTCCTYSTITHSAHSTRYFSTVMHWICRMFDCWICPAFFCVVSMAWRISQMSCVQWLISPMSCVCHDSFHRCRVCHDYDSDGVSIWYTVVACEMLHSICVVLQCVAVCCSVLQIVSCDAVCCRLSLNLCGVCGVLHGYYRGVYLLHHNSLQLNATHGTTLQRTATLCNTLQHPATHCNNLQLTAAHCNTLYLTETHQ